MDIDHIKGKKLYHHCKINILTTQTCYICNLGSIRYNVIELEFQGLRDPLRTYKLTCNNDKCYHYSNSSIIKSRSQQDMINKYIKLCPN